MKPIKLVLAVSLFTINIGLQAQSFFKDKTNIYYYLTLPSISQEFNQFSIFQKDAIQLDSTNSNMEEFYTIKQLGNTNYDSIFKLKIKNKKVYFSGYMQNIGNVMNKLIYDFNYNVGDTFTLNLDKPYKFKVDSIKPITYLDGKIRTTHYYKVNNAPFIAAEGIGSFKRLMYFNLFGFQDKWSYPIWSKVMSVCVNGNENIYFDGKFFKTDTIYQATCDEKNLKSNLLHSSLFINSENKPSFNLYPNPTRGNINITLQSPQTGQVVAFNTLGQILFSKSFENAENLNFELPNIVKGLVYIKVQTANYSAMKVVVVE